MSAGYIALGGFFWWFSGFLSFGWLSRGECLTWRELGRIVLWSFIGPIVWIIIGVQVLSDAEFWDKKICDTFKRNKP